MKHDDPTQGPISGTERTEPPGSDGAVQARGKGFREPLGENAVEQLRQYQVITMPPSARRALLGAQLPGASPELLYDTLPPNLAVQHDEPELPEEPEASRSVSPSRQRKLRAIVIGLAVLMVVLVVVAWGRQPSSKSPTASEPPTQPVAPLPAAPPEPPPVVEEVPRDVAPRAKAAAASEKSATGARLQPTKEPSVTASPAPPSPTGADAVSVPAAAPSANTGKKFRLGSR